MPSVNYNSISVSSGKPAVPSSTTGFTSGSYTVPAGKVAVVRVTLSASIVARSGTYDATGPSTNSSSQTFTVYAGQVLSFSSSAPSGSNATGGFTASATFLINSQTVMFITTCIQCPNNSSYFSSNGTAAYIEIYDI